MDAAMVWPYGWRTCRPSAGPGDASSVAASNSPSSASVKASQLHDEMYGRVAGRRPRRRARLLEALDVLLEERARAAVLALGMVAVAHVAARERLVRARSSTASPMAQAALAVLDGELGLALQVVVVDEVLVHARQALPRRRCFCASLAASCDSASTARAGRAAGAAGRRSRRRSMACSVFSGCRAGARAPARRLLEERQRPRRSRRAPPPWPRPWRRYSTALSHTSPRSAWWASASTCSAGARGAGLHGRHDRARGARGAAPGGALAVGHVVGEGVLERVLDAPGTGWSRRRTPRPGAGRALVAQHVLGRLA